MSTDNMNEEFATIHQHKKDWKIFVVGTKQINNFFFFFKFDIPTEHFYIKTDKWQL